MFTDTQLNIVSFCSEECKRQESGELSVYNMVKAYNFILDEERYAEAPVVEDVIVLALFVEPLRNINGFRNVPVSFKSGQVIGHENILLQMENLICAQAEISPEEFYRELMEIHPFIDGNGRVGAVIYNWLRGSLNDPVVPPDMFEPKFNQESGPRI